MNMKRIVFGAVGILVMLIIIGWMLHSITHIEEVNQQRREKNRGEAMASRMITTTATTSIWDVLRRTEPATGEAGTVPATPGTTGMQELPEASGGLAEETTPDNPEESADQAVSDEISSVPQTQTAVIQ